MSDIPIGTPPVPPGRHAAPSGWYPDPADPAQERYWDGWQWSRQTRAAAHPAPSARTGTPFTAPQGANPGWQQSAVPRPAATALSDDGRPLASWGARFLAAIIDIVIVGVLSCIAGFPILRRLQQQMAALFRASLAAAQSGQTLTAADAMQYMSPTDQWWLNVVIFAVGTVYAVAFLRWRGSTPGKLAVGIRVVGWTGSTGDTRTPVPTAERGLTWQQAITRALVWMVPQVISCLWVFTIVDCLVPLSRPDRRAIHDLIAKTQVIRTRGVPSLSPTHEPPPPQGFGGPAGGGV